MGQQKRQLEDEEEKSFVALSILTKTRVLEECRMHPGTYVDNGGGLDDAYKHAAYHFKRGEYPQFVDQRDITDSVKDAYDSFGCDECYSCEKIRAE